AWKIPAMGRDRIERIEDEVVGSRARRLFPGQQAVAAERVGAARAREVEGSRLRARERPLALVAPAVLAHDEEAHRRRQPVVARRRGALAAENVGGEAQ